MKCFILWSEKSVNGKKKETKIERFQGGRKFGGHYQEKEGERRIEKFDLIHFQRVNGLSFLVDDDILFRIERLLLSLFQA